MPPARRLPGVGKVIFGSLAEEPAASAGGHSRH